MKSAWLGRLLRGVRAGDSKLLWFDPHLAAIPDLLRVSSLSFVADGAMPVRYAGRGVGENVSPTLLWAGEPTATAELLLIVQDADVPLPKPWLHLLAFGIGPGRAALEEGELSSHRNGLQFGRNTGGGIGYTGPRALLGHGPHRYHFQLFALNRPSGLKLGSGLDDTRRVVRDAAIARGRLVGLFEQSST